MGGTAFGPLPTFSVRFCALRVVAAKGCPGRARRATEAVGAARRLPCGARVHGPAHNSLRSLRSLRSDRMRQKCPRGALRARAMNPALRGASHAPRALPGQPFAGTRAGTRRAPPSVLERQAVPGGVAVCGAEQRSLEGGARSTDPPKRQAHGIVSPAPRSGRLGVGGRAPPHNGTARRRRARPPRDHHPGQPARRPPDPRGGRRGEHPPPGPGPGRKAGGEPRRGPRGAGFLAPPDQTVGC